MATKMTDAIRKAKKSTSEQKPRGGTAGAVAINFDFQEISVGEMDAKRRRDMTDYGPLLNRLRETAPGKAVRFPVPEGAAPRKFREQVANAIKRSHLEDQTNKVFRTHLSRDESSIEIAVGARKTG